MTAKPLAVLLDTCAVIWLANGGLSQAVIDKIVEAGLSGGIYVSPVSAWEVGMLAKPRIGRLPHMQFLPDPKTWFARVMAGPGIREAAFTRDIAIDASSLPGEIHGDPADRLIISTSRHMQIPIVTSDTKIIDYARFGHIEVIPC
jgi:PIN domain nuclease of toxin-antitoxin system